MRPGGQFVAIEAKLLRARTFRVDARFVRQAETLRELGTGGAWVALALNFRYAAKRPARRVNRAFLVRDLGALAVTEGAAWTLDWAANLGVELFRITGGWTLPGAAWAAAPPAPRPGGEATE
jgi:hypothetical protein